MKMSEIIEKISVLYRSELSHGKELRDEYNEVVKKIMEADRTRGENITLANYQYLSARKQALKLAIDMHDEYRNGINEVREFLMDLGFDMEVE